jgi:acetyltransferase-like isoleucine patch superfamily enzyme
MAAIDPGTLGLRACGDDVRIYGLARLTDPDRIALGSHVILDDFTFLQGRESLTIGDHVHVAMFSSISGGGMATIGSFVTVSQGVRLFSGTDVPDGSGLTGSTISPEHRAVSRSRLTLHDFSFVGANTVVLPGVTIGEGTVVDAHSLVREDLEPWTIYVGSPARPARTRPRERMLATPPSSATSRPDRAAGAPRRSAPRSAAAPRRVTAPAPGRWRRPPRRP